MRLLPTIYNSLENFAKFKAGFHHIYINVFKEHPNKWNELPYLATNDVIFTVLELWLLEWCAPTSSTLKLEKFAV